MRAVSVVTRGALGALVMALLGLSSGRARSAPTLSGGLTAEAGPEVDSNARRTTQTAAEAPILAPLLRLVVGGHLALHGTAQRLSLRYDGGGKIFLSESGRLADEMVHSGAATWLLRPRPGLALTVSGAYYDAFQRHSERDFRTGSVFARVAFAPGSNPTAPDRRTPVTHTTSAAFQLGYQGLQYKPLADYGFHGFVGGAVLSRDFRIARNRGEELDPLHWRLTLSYHAALRAYRGPLLGMRERCPDSSSSVCTFPKEGHRGDLNHVARIEAQYSGPALATLWYSVEVNDSNSYGESFTRHALGLKFTARLIWKAYLTAKGVLQLSQFRDPYLLSQVSSQVFATIDDENRSSLMLHLGRELTERWSINVRYAVFVNESSQVEGAQLAGFIRHTLYVGLRFEYGSTD